MPRDTRTGVVLEKMVVPALESGGYGWQRQVIIGKRPGGRDHKVDYVIKNPDGDCFLVSVKWQQTSGTAEQKVPFEVICLAEAILENPGKYAGAYLVLGGDGWTLRDYYTGDGLSRHLKHSGLVRIVTLERFVALANQGRL